MKKLLNILIDHLIEITVFTAFLGVGLSFHKLYAFHLFFILSLLYIGRSGLSNIKTLIQSKLLIGWIIVLLWYITSSIWSADLKLNIIYCTYLLLGIGIIFIINFSQNLNNKYRVPLRAIKYAYLLHLIICLLEIFTPFRWPISPASELAPLFGRKLDIYPLKDIQTLEYIKTLPISFYWNINNSGLITICGIPFILLRKELKYRLIGAIALSLVIFYTRSRGAYIAGALSVCMCIIFNLKYFVRYLSLPLAILLTIITLSYNTVQDGGQQDIKSIKKLVTNFVSVKKSIENSDASMSIRVKLSRNAFQHYTSNTKNILLGLGGGTLPTLSFEHKGEKFQLGTIHNFWLQLLVESGIFIFILILFLFFYLPFSLLYQSFKEKDDNQIYLLRATAISLLTFYIGVLALSHSIYFLPMWVMVGFATLLTNSFDPKISRQSKLKESTLSHLA